MDMFVKQKNVHLIGQPSPLMENGISKEVNKWVNYKL